MITSQMQMSVAMIQMAGDAMANQIKMFQALSLSAVELPYRNFKMLSDLASVPFSAAGLPFGTAPKGESLPAPVAKPAAKPVAKAAPPAHQIRRARSRGTPSRLGPRARASVPLLPAPPSATKNTPEQSPPPKPTRRRMIAPTLADFDFDLDF